MQQKIVITGGPGTGKTMVINELLKRKYNCMSEISREITLNAKKNGIDQLFLTDPLLFSRLLLEGRIAQFKEANLVKSKNIFFDRGIPDIHSYMKYLGTEYPDMYIIKSNEYKYSRIFLMPPWEEIYTSDNERYESYEQSLFIYQHIKNGYLNLGYEITEVPHGTISKRTNFILDSI